MSGAIITNAVSFYNASSFFVFMEVAKAVLLCNWEEYRLKKTEQLPITVQQGLFVFTEITLAIALRVEHASVHC